MGPLQTRAQPHARRLPPGASCPYRRLFRYLQVQSLPLEERPGILCPRIKAPLAESESRHIPLGSTDCVRIGAFPFGKRLPEETAVTLTTLGSNLSANTARLSATSDLSSTANRLLSPAFSTSLVGLKLSWAIREPFRVVPALASIAVGKLVRDAFCVPPAPEFITASSAAD